MPRIYASLSIVIKAKAHDNGGYFIVLNVYVAGVRQLAVSAMKKPEVIFILGGPGAGKGTTCSDIVKKTGYVHLSAGDLLREERTKPDAEFGEIIETHIRNGTIVPVEITCSLLERAMQTSANPEKRFLIDGFPRNEDNLNGWTKVRLIYSVKKKLILFKSKSI